MKIYTIGYGGRKPQEFLRLLKERGIRAVVDVRLRPDRSSMGIYVKAKDAGKGIERLLASAGIGYFSFVELGNIFRDMDDWSQQYQCLMCDEKHTGQCHRKLIVDYPVKEGYLVEHIE